MLGLGVLLCTFWLVSGRAEDEWAPYWHHNCLGRGLSVLLTKIFYYYYYGNISGSALFVGFKSRRGTGLKVLDLDDQRQSSLVLQGPVKYDLVRLCFGSC